MPCDPSQPSRLAGCGDDYATWTCADLGYEDAVGVQPGCDLSYETAVDGLLCAWDVRPCEAAPCGNGVVQPSLGETCDDGGATLAGCPYGDTESCTRCDASCQPVDEQPARFCGDGVLDPEEVCEVGTSTACDYGYLQENDMHCLPDCTGWDRSACQPSVCGDGVHSLSEECDPPAAEIPTCDYGDEDCPWAGTTYCSADCTLQDVALRRCGDGIVEEVAEDCEPGDRREVVCPDGMPTVQHCSELCGWAPLSCKGEDAGMEHLEWVCDIANLDDEEWSGQPAPDARGTRSDAGPDGRSTDPSSDAGSGLSRRAPEPPEEQGCSTMGGAPAGGTGWLLLLALATRRRRSAKRRGVGALMATALLVGCVEDPELHNAPSEDVLDARVMRKETPIDTPYGPCTLAEFSTRSHCGLDHADWDCVDHGFGRAEGVRPLCNRAASGSHSSPHCPWDVSPCLANPCGNGVLQPTLGEECDDGGATLEACAYGDPAPCESCDALCQIVVRDVGRTCGDGVIDAEEVCELGESSPCGLGFLPDGVRTCAADCLAWDTSACEPAACGACDPTIVTVTYCADGTTVENACSADCSQQPRTCAETVPTGPDTPTPDGCSAAAPTSSPWFWLVALGIGRLRTTHLPARESARASAG